MGRCAEASKQGNRQANKQAGKQANKQTSKQKSKQANKQGNIQFLFVYPENQIIDHGRLDSWIGLTACGEKFQLWSRTSNLPVDKHVGMCLKQNAAA